MVKGNQYVMSGVLMFLTAFGADAKIKDKHLSNNLFVEQAVNVGEFNFSNNEWINPERSSFKVVNYVMMSNEKGHRYAAVTFENIADSKRRLTHEQVMALYGNGKRRLPQVFEQDFYPGEKITLTLRFASSKFPLLQVYTLGLD